MALLVCFLTCPLVSGGQAFGVVLSSCGVFPPFCPLCRFMLVLSLANMALFRVLRAFLGGFMGFVWVCVVLVFAWLVWLLCACGVRRFKGLRRICPSFYPFASVFALLLSFCPFLCPLWSCCPRLVLSLSLWVVVVSFSLADGFRHKKKGRNSLRPLILIVIFYISFIRLRQSLSCLQKNNIAHLR